MREAWSANGEEAADARVAAVAAAELDGDVVVASSKGDVVALIGRGAAALIVELHVRDGVAPTRVAHVRAREVWARFAEVIADVDRHRLFPEVLRDQVSRRADGEPEREPAAPRARALVHGTRQVIRTGASPISLGSTLRSSSWLSDRGQASFFRTR